jgi:bacterioferritin
MSELLRAAPTRPFLTDIKVLHDRACGHLMEAASYGGSTELDCRILNEALATEIVCVLRYKRHHYIAKRIHSDPLQAEFFQHTVEEQDYVEGIAKRIVQLGGQPNFLPDYLLSRNRPEHIDGSALREMIAEDIVAERIAIESYRGIASYFAPFDSITCELIENVMTSEEEYTGELAELLERFPLTHEAR